MTRAALTRPGPEPEFESLQSAARRTGFSVFTFRDKIAAGELPAYRLTAKPGSQIRVKVADVNALMKPLVPEDIYPTYSSLPD